jgi:chorismate mutase
MSEIDADPVVRSLRARIADTDRQILAAVNARLELVAKLKEHKDAQGYVYLDRSRESAMLELLTGENAGPLSSGGLAELYRALVELTKRETGMVAPRAPASSTSPRRSGTDV